MQGIGAAQGMVARPTVERVLQFGEGNFIRAFADWMIDLANRDGVYDGSVVVVQPIQQGLCGTINEQDGLYTVVTRDQVEGALCEESQVVRCISRCIDPYTEYAKLLEVAHSDTLEVVLSNTTEQGIAFCADDLADDAPPSSFPGKLTVVLYERFRHFGGAADKGLLIIPLELVDDNGEMLREAVLRYAAHWRLGEAFREWFQQACRMATTLVDRIVTGYPRDSIGEFEQKLGYRDRLLTTCERYNLLAIQGPAEWADTLPIHRAGANVIWADDIKPYRDRKLRILNGAHNAFGLAAFLAGHKYVIDVMRDELFVRFLKKAVYDEIVPNLPDAAAATAFADETLRRFANPYIRHDLLQIAVHGCAKFRLRCLPSLLDFQKRTGEVPPALAFSLAAFLAFYRGERTAQGYVGKLGDGVGYPIRDTDEVVAFFAETWQGATPAEVAAKALSHRGFWDGQDLAEIPGLRQQVADWLTMLTEQGVRETIQYLLG